MTQQQDFDRLSSHEFRISVRHRRNGLDTWMRNLFTHAHLSFKGLWLRAKRKKALPRDREGISAEKGRTVTQQSDWLMTQLAMTRVLARKKLKGEYNYNIPPTPAHNNIETKKDPPRDGTPFASEVEISLSLTLPHWLIELLAFRPNVVIHPIACDKFPTMLTGIFIVALSFPHMLTPILV